jgi:hypothetical protein
VRDRAERTDLGDPGGERLERVGVGDVGREGLDQRPPVRQFLRRRRRRVGVEVDQEEGVDGVAERDGAGPAPAAIATVVILGFLSVARRQVLVAAMGGC